VDAEYERLANVLTPLSQYLIPHKVYSHQDLDGELARPTPFFHYSGHTDDERGQAYLMRWQDDDPAARLYADRLADRLRAAGTRFAFFSACNSGRWSFVEPLLRRGLRALIGTQGLVSSIGATAFAEKVYHALAVGLSLDEAVGWGRLHLLRATQPVDGGQPEQLSYEWGAFMVYMPSSDSVLLHPPDEGLDRSRAEVRGDSQITYYNVTQIIENLNGTAQGIVLPPHQ
jgi:hypothetical protein